MPLSTQSRYAAPLRVDALLEPDPAGPVAVAVPCARRRYSVRASPVAAGVERVLVQLADRQRRVAVQLLAHEQFLHPVLGEPEPHAGRLVRAAPRPPSAGRTSSVVTWVGRCEQRAAATRSAAAARCASVSTWLSVSMWARSATSIAGWAHAAPSTSERAPRRLQPRPRSPSLAGPAAGSTGSAMPRCSPITSGRRGRLDRHAARDDQQEPEQLLAHAVGPGRGERAGPVDAGQEARVGAHGPQQFGQARRANVSARRRGARSSCRLVGGRPPPDPPVQQPPADLPARRRAARPADRGDRPPVWLGVASGRTARTPPGRCSRPATGSGRRADHPLASRPGRPTACRRGTARPRSSGASSGRSVSSAGSRSASRSRDPAGERPILPGVVGQASAGPRLREPADQRDGASIAGGVAPDRVARCGPGRGRRRSRPEYVLLPGYLTAPPEKLVRIAPSPRLAGLGRAHHGMVGGVLVCGRVLARRVVAAADVPADQALAEMDPPRSLAQAVAAPLRSCPGSRRGSGSGGRTARWSFAVLVGHHTPRRGHRP